MSTDGQDDLQEYLVIDLVVPCRLIIIVLKPDSRKFGGIEFQGTSQPVGSASEIDPSAREVKIILKDTEHIVSCAESPPSQLIEGLDVPSILGSL